MECSAYQTIEVKHDGRVAVVTLNRSEKLNAVAFVEKRPPRFQGR
ncbi:MAG: hypothetical protein ACE5JD_15885 [Candidatus Methylomirabilia bacterium]